MAEDREVVREVWEARVAVAFTLSGDEMVTMQRPDPFFLMSPRLSFFPLLLDPVLRYFRRFVADHLQHGTDVWLEYEGQKLKWHYPIGLLFDLYVTEPGSSLPWSITVHFSDFPEQELVRCASRPALESLFLATVKEADVLKHRGDIMSNMQKRDHNQLWSGLVGQKMEQFWSVNKKLMTPPFRSVPIRFYFPDSPSFVQPLVRTEDQPDLTFGQLMSMSVLRQRFPSSRPSGEPGTSDEAEREQEDKWRLVLHGQEVPMDTPLQWAAQHLSHPDNFIHVSVHSRPRPPAQ